MNAKLLPKAVFSVSPTERVQFTRGALFHDGKEYGIEEDQFTIARKRDPHHISHFVWYSEREAGEGAEPWSGTYEGHARSGDDTIFVPHLEAEGKKLSVLSGQEWEYLLSHHRHCNLTVDGTAGLVLLPEGYTHPANLPALSDDIAVTMKEWKAMEAEGAVLLSADTGVLFISESGCDLRTKTGPGLWWCSSAAGVMDAECLETQFKKGCVQGILATRRGTGLPVRCVVRLPRRPLLSITVNDEGMAKVVIPDASEAVNAITQTIWKRLSEENTDALNILFAAVVHTLAMDLSGDLDKEFIENLKNNVPEFREMYRARAEAELRRRQMS